MTRSSPSHWLRLRGTLVLLALAALLAAGLLHAVRTELRPPAPGQAPPPRPRLLTVLEGVMATNVTPAERRLFEAWVREGAGPEGYSRVEAVVANNCASCHGPGGEHPRVTDYPELRALALEPTPEGLGRLLGARIVHLAVFPLCLLAVALGYLAETGPGARRFLRVWAVAICLLDAALWAWRGGRPEHLGLAQATAALVGLTMAGLVAVALRNLWSRNP